MVLERVLRWTRNGAFSYEERWGLCSLERRRPRRKMCVTWDPVNDPDQCLCPTSRFCSLNLDHSLDVSRIKRSSSSRIVRSKRVTNCSKSEYKPQGKDYCCNKCTRGHYKKSDCSGPDSRTVCAECKQETFLAFENAVSKCKSCKVCDPVLSQVQMKECLTYSDRVCGCALGTYKFSIDSTTFSCNNCSLCKTEVLLKCSGSNDTVCSCETDFFYDLEEKKCRRCERCRGKFQCSQCPDVKSTGSNTYLILSIFSCSAIGAMLVLGVGYFLSRNAAICSLFKQKKVKLRPPYISEVTETISELDPGSPDRLLPIQEEGQSPSSVPLHPTRITELPDCVQGAGSSPLPDNNQVNYTIADLVPASRWKEFVRRLGLSDHHIERAEMDCRSGYREAQYQMFRVWRQKQGAQCASLELVYRALRDMDLNRCAEELQERLQ